MKTAVGAAADFDAREHLRLLLWAHLHWRLRCAEERERILRTLAGSPDPHGSSWDDWHPSTHAGGLNREEGTRPSCE